MNPMPSSASRAARRTLSRQFELPPSITTSPGASKDERASTVCSVGSPAGTITHRIRGVARASTHASSVETSRVSLDVSNPTTS